MNAATTELVHLLIQAGAIPGEDFSCDGEHQALRLNARCYTLLERAYPEVDWADILGQPQDWVDAAIADLHHRLGCPFVDTLTQRMATRLPHLNDEAAIAYVQTLLWGVEAATGLALYPQLVAALDLASQVRLAWLLRPGETGEEAPLPWDSAWLGDVLGAAGGTPLDFQGDGDGVLLTERGLGLLSQVWQGDGAITPVVAALPAVPPQTQR